MIKKHSLNPRLPQPDNSLDKFNQWVAAKSANNPLQANRTNVILFQPKNNQPKIRPMQLPFATHFFKKPEVNRLPIALFSNFFQQQMEMEKQKPQAKVPSLNLSCNYCGENGHSSASCPEPSSQKRR